MEDRGWRLEAATEVFEDLRGAETGDQLGLGGGGGMAGGSGGGRQDWVALFPGGGVVLQPVADGGLDADVVAGALAEVPLVLQDGLALQIEALPEPGTGDVRRGRRQWREALTPALLALQLHQLRNGGEEEVALLLGEVHLGGGSSLVGREQGLADQSEILFGQKGEVGAAGQAEGFGAIVNLL